MNKLISVIIPVYNPGKHLVKCLESIINQTHKNLEIILIDDGSSDGSGATCDEYAKKDSRIICIHQQNAGVSKARNRGLEIATGDYLHFPDSDDYLELDEVCPVFNKFGSEKNNYEMVKDIQESLLKKHSCIVDKVFGSPFFNKEIYCFLKTKHINNCSKINAKHIKLQYNLLNGQMGNFGYQTTANEHIASVLSFNTIIQKLKKY